MVDLEKALWDVLQENERNFVSWAALADLYEEQEEESLAWACRQLADQRAFVNHDGRRVISSALKWDIYYPLAWKGKILLSDVVPMTDHVSLARRDHTPPEDKKYAARMRAGEGMAMACAPTLKNCVDALARACPRETYSGG